MSYSQLLKTVENYIKSFYIEHNDPRLFYHNYSRTRDVVDVAQKMSEYYRLDERSRFIVCAAAWFQDAGCLLGNFDAHQLKSAELAENYLKTKGADEEDIDEIKKCIVANTKPAPPASLLEKIICDADMFHWGTHKFKENYKFLKKETEARKNAKINGSKWRAENIKMLETHQYYTDYCKLLLDKTKQEHLDELKDTQLKKSLERETSSTGKNGEVKMKDDTVSTENGKPVNQKRPTRGIETMFRISSDNSQRISMMGDNKAHIMISVNSIIISVVLGLIVQKLDESRHLIVPTIILLAINVTTIIYSVLATRPKVTKGTFTPEQVENKTVNLLFYGSFYNMNFKEYNSGMRQMMEDRDFLYGSLIKDNYWQGKVLGRKYRLLRISYNIFMYGIAVAVIAYTLTALIYG